MTVEPWIKTGHCQTRDGREVRIYATDGGGQRPIQGAICVKGAWEVALWGEDGMYLGLEDEYHSDLVPVDATSREMWGRFFEGTDAYPLNVTRDHEGRVTKVELAE